MVTVREIKASVAAEMKYFEKKFKVSMQSDVRLLDKITHYIIKRKGKQMRPLFVFLTAKTLCQKINESTYTAASLIELLHTATLVHDDVVDDANERRGFFSVNALWKNKIAVLVGDYLLSKGLLLSVCQQEYRLLGIVSNSVKEMSEGELLQMEKSRKLDITESVYFKIIRQKTASLIASCCAAGAASVTTEEPLIAKMKKFGELVGLAFQIKDDIFDYGTDKGIGKPTGNDIRERKLTLPLIHTLSKATRSERKVLVNILKNRYNDPKCARKVVQKVVDSGGIHYARERMMALKEEAIDCIADLESNEAKKALIGLVEYTVNRKR